MASVADRREVAAQEDAAPARVTAESARAFALRLVEGREAALTTPDPLLALFPAAMEAAPDVVTRQALAAQPATGLTLPAARLARARASSTSAPLATATPMRRLTKDSGLPNRRRSLRGTASASATPS